MNRARLFGAVKVTSSDKIRKIEPQIYNGKKAIIIGSKKEFYQLITY